MQETEPARLVLPAQETLQGLSCPRKNSCKACPARVSAPARLVLPAQALRNIQLTFTIVYNYLWNAPEGHRVRFLERSYEIHE